MDLQDNRGPLILRAIYPLSALATLAVIGRFLSRKVMKMSWEIDDYAIVVALVYLKPRRTSAFIKAD